MECTNQFPKYPMQNSSNHKHENSISSLYAELPTSHFLKVKSNIVLDRQAYQVCRNMFNMLTCLYLSNNHVIIKCRKVEKLVGKCHINKMVWYFVILV